MHKSFAIALLCGASLMLGGCLPWRRSVEPVRVSLKDDALPSSGAHSAVSPAPKPRGTQGIAIDEKARAEQWQRCAQRHVDYQAGKLNETVEQKRLRDEICAELHRTDHARQGSR